MNTNGQISLSMLRLLLAVWLIIPVVQIQAQSTDLSVKVKRKDRGFDPINQKVPVTKLSVDTLSLLDRFSIHSNVVDWAVMVPNIGVEFDIKNRTWNRWTVGANVRYNWQTKHTFITPIVFNFFEARIEARQYWRTRQIGEHGIEPHSKIWDKAFSIRRNRVKHPSTTWYRGVFVSYDKYSVMMSNTGHQGEAMIAGITYGLVRPLYAFANGGSVDLDIGISGGFVAVRDATYCYDDVANRYPITKQGRWRVLPFPIPNEVRVGLVYRFGPHHVLSKYRYRHDNDLTYKELRDSLHDVRIKILTDRKAEKDAYKHIESRLWHIYDSIARQNRMRREVKRENK